MDSRDNILTGHGQKMWYSNLTLAVEMGYWLYMVLGPVWIWAVEMVHHLNIGRRDEVHGPHR